MKDIRRLTERKFSYLVVTDPVMAVYKIIFFDYITVMQLYRFIFLSILNLYILNIDIMFKHLYKNFIRKFTIF